MQNFITSLEQSYRHHRQAISQNLIDIELRNDLEFQKCLIINNILGNNFVFETAYSIWNDQDEQDIEKFLDRYTIEYGIEANGFTYMIKEKNVESN